MIFFRVKTIWVRDGALEPIEVRFEREVDPEENDGKPIKEVKRTLFQVMNPYPQKKAITFNRFQDDFNFTVHIGNKMAQKAELKGIKAAIEEYSDAESKGVKAHFRMDESGIIRLESAEATFQKEVIEEVPKKEEKKKDSKDAPEFDKGTLDAIKDKFKDFFNGDASNEEDAKKVLEELSKAQKKDGADEKASEENTEDEEPKAEESEEKTEESKDETAEEPKSEEPTEETADKTEETAEDDAKKSDEDKMRDEWGADEIEKEAAKEAEEEAKAAEEVSSSYFPTEKYFIFYRRRKLKNQNQF